MSQRPTRERDPRTRPDERVGLALEDRSTEVPPSRGRSGTSVWEEARRNQCPEFRKEAPALRTRCSVIYEPGDKREQVKQLRWVRHTWGRCRSSHCLPPTFSGGERGCEWRSCVAFGRGVPTVPVLCHPCVPWARGLSERSTLTGLEGGGAGCAGHGWMTAAPPASAPGRFPMHISRPDNVPRAR